MKRQSSYNQGSGLKIALYALGLVIVAGIIFLIMHDIKVPTEHVSQPITISIEND